MKILAITACTAGIAHTYIAKEKLENAAKDIGTAEKHVRCSKGAGRQYKSRNTGIYWGRE